MSKKEKIDTIAQELFDERMDKQLSLAKKLSLICFVPICILFILIGFVCLFFAETKVLGVAFVIIGFILLIVLASIFVGLAFAKKQLSYQKFNEYAQKCGFCDIFGMEAKIDYLENKVAELEGNKESNKKED